MGVSDDDEWNSDSGEDDRDDQGNDDVREVIHATSAPGGSATSILLLPERNEEDTGWLTHEGINPASAFNKMKPEDLATVRKRKDMLAQEVAKNASLVDQWLRDKVNPSTWNKNETLFPEGKKCLPQQKWMLLPDDTASASPVRYQQYGITIKLNPDKDDCFHKTYNSLGKKHPQLWVCCANYSCNAVYDVTNSNDTQRNVHLSQHHMLGVTPLHSREALHTARMGRIAQATAAAAKRNMPADRLAHVRVARFFIKKMLAFSVCEDAAYREQASVDWKACKRDTMRATIGECFLVTAAQTKLAIRCTLKRAVLAPFHLNADLWTSKVSHQKFLGVRIFWKVGAEMKSALLAVTLYAPPKVENKKASDWLLEYVLAVLEWYGIETGHVKGVTSDSGSDCKRAFNVLAAKHDWMWLWCFPHAMHCALVECLGTQKDRSKVYCPPFPASVRLRVQEKTHREKLHVGHVHVVVPYLFSVYATPETVTPACFLGPCRL